MSEATLPNQPTLRPTYDHARVADAELLTRFTSNGDEAAFEELVGRHGPMVLGLCRRVLIDPHAAADAFQSTFLLLARKAPAICKPERLGNWLYGVAYRVARRARHSRPEPTSAESVESTDLPPERDAAFRELQSVVGEELHRLPTRDRLLLTLAYFDGMSHQQIASHLGWPSGSVSRRIKNAEEALRRRLQRRGVVEYASLSLLPLCQLNLAPAVPRELAQSTVASAVADGAAAKAGAAEWFRRGAATRFWVAAAVLVALLVGAWGVAVQANLMPAPNAHRVAPAAAGCASGSSCAAPSDVP